FEIWSRFSRRNAECGKIARLAESATLHQRLHNSSEWALALCRGLSFGLAAAAQAIRRAYLLIFCVVRSSCALCAVLAIGRAGVLCGITAFGYRLGRGFDRG